MPELRWILLILGAAFVAALAWWELRRQKRFPAPPPEKPTQHRFREPDLGLPEIRPRESAPDLPVFEIDDDSMIGLRVDGVRIEEDMGAATFDALAKDGAMQDGDAALPPDAPAPVADVLQQRRPETASALPDADPLPEPIVEWPPEEERRLVSLRLVPQPGARFLGRALRLALTSEGFVLGKFSIFHKPGPDARALMSAASLTQPGTFDLETMDAHRYGGLGLFAVLPGPLPDAQMFDELLATARVLNERLEGALQDERGEPLTVLRAASLREKLESPQPAASSSDPEPTS
jgi:hypothetical protein